MYRFLFLAMFIGILLGAHALLGVAIIHFFALTSTRDHSVVMAVLFFLSLSFFLASTLAHWEDTLFTRSLYFISGLWLGFLVNLLLASLVTWCIISTATFFGVHGITPSILATIIFSIAIALSSYGSWNAFHPRVTEVTVHIPYLPEQWKGKKIVQLSDIHLGHIYRERFLQSIVDQTNSLHPDVVVITGDLFDGMDGNLETLAAPLQSLQSVWGTFFVTGNHETYLGIDNTVHALRDTTVRRLDDEVVDIDGLALIGISYPERGVAKDMATLIDQLRPGFQGKPSVLLFHAPTHIDIFQSAGINLQLSGHTHVGQLFPFGFITRLVYRGHDYGLHKQGDYSLYTTNGVGTWGPAMRLGNTPEIVSLTLQ